MARDWSDNGLGTAKELNITPNSNILGNSASALDTSDRTSLALSSSSSAAAINMNLSSQSSSSTDLVWRNYATGENAVWQMNGTTLSSAQLIQPIGDVNWKIEGTGDFNNDGNSDLVWRNYATGENAVWFMNGTTFSGAQLLQSIGDVNWKIEGTGDFNSDGKTDLVWRNYATGQNAMWFMNGTTLSSGQLFQSVGDVNWKIAGTGNFHGGSAPPDNAGNTLNTAKNITVGSTTISFNDFVGNADNNDYYRFSLGTTSNFNLNLNGLSANANVQLLDSNGAVIQGSGQGGTVAESISRLLTAGDYYIQVYPESGANTNYALSVSATPGEPGNTLGTAAAIGTLSGTRTFTDSVNPTDDRNDYYRFNLANNGTFDLSLSNLLVITNMELVRDSNGNGIHDAGETMFSTYAYGGDTASINTILQAGNYFIRIFSYYTDRNTTYTVSASTNAIPATTTSDPGNTLNSALDIGTLSGTRSFTDFVSPTDDRNDYYRFNLANNGTFDLSLSDILVITNMELVRDSNGNGIHDASETMFSTYAYGGDTASINTVLQAGNYFIRIFSYYTDRNTTYTVSATIS